MIESENPSKNRPPAWTDYFGLPIHFHGAVPDANEAQLDAMFPQGSSARRVEMFVNPVTRPANGILCTAGDTVQSKPQLGRYAYVVGALCDGSSVVTYATATILTAGLAPQQIKRNLEMLHLQLWQALTYGNNHPELAHPSWMYGP